MQNFRNQFCEQAFLLQRILGCLWVLYTSLKHILYFLVSICFIEELLYKLCCTYLTYTLRRTQDLMYILGGYPLHKRPSASAAWSILAFCVLLSSCADAQCAVCLLHLWKCMVLCYWRQVCHWYQNLELAHRCIHSLLLAPVPDRSPPLFYSYACDDFRNII